MLMCRHTRCGTGFLTSLAIVGSALLDFAIDKLRIEDMEEWRSIERGMVGGMIG